MATSDVFLNSSLLATGSAGGPPVKFDDSDVADLDTSNRVTSHAFVVTINKLFWSR